jgi:hypothetical protein
VKVLIVTIAFLVSGPVAVSAAVPDPTHCTAPSYIELVGSSGGVPDPNGQIVVTVRDFANNPIQGSRVELDFSNCSDSKLSLSQQAGVSVDCSSKLLSTTTNILGQAIFVAMGASNVAQPPAPPAIAPGAGTHCAICYADGVLIGTMTVVTPDLNGFVTGDGVNGIDYEVLFNELVATSLGAPYRGRDDFDHNGIISAADLASFFARYIEPGGSVDAQAPPYGLGFCP